MSEGWRVQLLKGLRVQHGDVVITRFKTQRAGALLAYVAYYRHRSHSRDELTERLWPGVDPDAGRNSLRVALHSLRRSLEATGAAPESLLVADRASLTLHPDAHTDAAAFDTALLAADGAVSPTDRAGLLSQALALYPGELLPGYVDEWVLTERQHMQERYLEAMHERAAALEHVGELEQSLGVARRLVEADPLREEAHYDLMRLYAAMGQPSATLRQYQELERLLRDELGEAPSAATRALAEELRRNARTLVVARAAQRVDSTRVPVLAPPNPGLPLAPPRYPDHPNGTRLPRPLTPFFGREEEIARIVEALSLPEVRLVTLTGPAGSGKSRLGLAVAHRLQPSFPGLIAFVPLADLSNADRFLAALADALGLPPGAGADPLDPLLAALRFQPTLLLLDNFEHLLDGAAPVLQNLLARAPTLTCLVTSRQHLDLEGEREFALMPLPTPRRAEGAEQLLGYASVQLFVDRAQAARASFRLTEENAAVVAALCDRLEGLPLAIELAASWVQTLAPGQILERLSRRFELLVSHRRDQSARHRSLRAAIEWSYELLPHALREFFAGLSIFRGGWILEAAEAVCGGLVGHGSVVEGLQQLQERSLVVAEEAGEAMRYRQLETLREYAGEQLPAEARAALARRHAEYYCELAERAEAEWLGAGQAAWMQRMEREHENLRAALAWSLSEEAAPGHPQGVPLRRQFTPQRDAVGAPLVGALRSELGLRLAGALGGFWANHPTEGRQWLTAALAKSPDAPAAPRAKALQAAGRLAVVQGDREPGRGLLEESLSLWRACGDSLGIARALDGLAFCARKRDDLVSARSFLEESVSIRREAGARGAFASTLEHLGTVVAALGDVPRGRSLYEESLAVSRECGARPIIGAALRGLGDLAWRARDFTAAGRFCEEALAIFRELGDRSKVVMALYTLSQVTASEGDHARACALLEERLALAREMGQVPDIIHTLGALGHLEREQGRYPQCAALYAESLALRQKHGTMRELGQSLEDHAGLAGRLGQWERAARLLGAAEAAYRTIGLAPPQGIVAEYHRTVDEARTALGEPALAAAWAAGAGMPLEQAIALALASTQPF